MGRAMSMLTVAGILFAILGIAGLAIPVFTTQQTTDVAKVGDLKLQMQESTSYAIPPLASGGALAFGIVLIGAGLYRKR